jgi:hypothetical protein
LDIADFGGADYVGDSQIAVGRLGGADAVRLVGEIEIVAAAIRFAEDGHRFDAQLAASADNPQRDFPAISDKDSLIHNRSNEYEQVCGMASNVRRRGHVKPSRTAKRTRPCRPKRILLP